MGASFIEFDFFSLNNFANNKYDYHADTNLSHEKYFTALRYCLYSLRSLCQHRPEREETMIQWLRDRANVDVSGNVNELSLLILLISAFTVATLAM
jgi:hypothetical protein